jgi:quercetin dioxygenase-like cupin family protein
MRSTLKSIAGVALSLCCAFTAANLALTRSAARQAEAPKKERARIVLARSLPQFNGNSLKATLVEVNYGPGEASKPHSHPCAVMAYVVKGAIRTQVEGQPLAIYKAGESFYEAPNDIHLVSANASSTEPATFVAYLLCAHEGPLSVDVPQDSAKKDVK